MNLTDEQELFIEKALAGNNVFVDACIGSGKTTAIQHLCNAYPADKKILYLTYNKLLKVDAREKIKMKNVTVTNYHGFAWVQLNRAGIKAGIQDLVQTFNRVKPFTPAYDVLILDEYQDIEQELADMLLIIKKRNPDMQIVAVGDIKQKIFDKTTLDVMPFIMSFLGEHIELEFTKCFRLNEEHASFLSRVWGKKIQGVNKNAKISHMRKFDVVKYLSEQDPSDIICLGAKTGAMAEALNRLESKYPAKYNKRTVFATITDNDRSGKVEPSKDTAIFTTFDSSKGLERKICVVFDFTESYWQSRTRKPQVKYEIMRNIFCVAASRGKDEIIFVDGDVKSSSQETDRLSEKTLSTPTEMVTSFDTMQMSSMFDFKYKEDIEECFALIDKKKIDRKDNSVIKIRENDYLIDLTPCVGIFQEAFFFENYSIDTALDLFRQTHQDINVDLTKYKKLDKKILYLVSLETSQQRYINQVEGELVEDDARDLLKARLEEEFNGKEMVQKEFEMQFADSYGLPAFAVAGLCDVIKNGMIYELKFVSELSHEHFLQLAMYLVASDVKTGRLWNVRDNTMWEISIPDRTKFLNAVAKTVTKHQILKFKEPKQAKLWKKTFKEATVV